MKIFIVSTVCRLVQNIREQTTWSPKSPIVDQSVCVMCSHVLAIMLEICPTPGRAKTLVYLSGLFMQRWRKTSRNEFLNAGSELLTVTRRMKTSPNEVEAKRFVASETGVRVMGSSVFRPLGRMCYLCRAFCHRPSWVVLDFTLASR